MATHGVTAVERALAVIECFRDGDGPLSLKILAERSGLNKATIIRLIVSLEKFGYIVRTGQGEYDIGPMFMHFGSIYQASFSMSQHAVPILRQLMQQTGHSTQLYVREGDMRYCLHRVASTAILRINVREGERRELLPGSSGKVMLAFSDDPDERVGWADVRETYFAINDRERHQDIVSIGAPVFGPNGKLVAAMTVNGPTGRFDAAAIHRSRPFLLEAAARLTAALGGDRRVFAAAMEKAKVPA